MQQDLSLLPGLLLPWYAKNKRDLPWRQDREPYHIWLSEIMLQQTRVEAVKGYYARFLQQLPTVEALASCDDGLLHKLWEGLGYYSRVRNLKKAAQIILQQYGGTFPETHSQLLSLPGVGDYTAGAIASIAFNEPVPAVDGNVLRVFSRLTGDDTPIDLPNYKKSVRTALERIYPPEAGEFTQALMELGATVCGPNRKPDCAQCPLSALCRAFRQGTAEQLPVKLPKKNRRQADMTVFLLSCDGCIALEKREDQGLLAGLWQFPNVPGHLSPQEAVSVVEALGLKPLRLLRQVDRKHIFTHMRWDMRGYYIELAHPGGAFNWLTLEQIRAHTALPTAFRQFLEDPLP